jgi:transcriptional regulator with GAF, ATPase, and Fis domain
VNVALPPAADFVCVSSGTAEMRAAWFLLTAAGFLRATLLHLGSPAEPLFGAAQVKEVRLDSADWASLRDLLLPMDYFRPARTPLPPAPAAPAARQRQPAASLNDEAACGAPPEPPAASAPAEAPFDAVRLYSRTAKLEPQEFMAELAAPCEAEPEPEPSELDEALQELGITIASATMRQAAERAWAIAGADCAALILGETGTGKELFAKLVHRLSGRRHRPMVAINCAAIPASLMESHLFGHVRGSFTGAAADHKGKFEQADGGVLFLDEIGELPPEAQAKLLRIIEDGLVDPIGAARPRKVDVRIVAATNRNLAGEAAEGRFRQDLYFRLNPFRIELSPLRERTAEIAPLAAAILEQINARRSTPCRLSKAGLRRLEQHSWPGNVRELSGVLRSSVLLAGCDVLEPEHLLIDAPAPKADVFSLLPDPAPGFSLESFLTQVRAHLIRRALEKAGLNQSEAARLLGISKQAVNQFLRE